MLNGYIDIDGCKLQIVPVYKLLGGMIDCDSSNGPELQNRHTAVSRISAPYHKYVSTKATLQPQQLVTCMNSLVVSSLLFNSHTWCNLSEAQLHQIDSRLATAYGSCIPYKLMFLGISGKFRKLSDKHVFSTTNMPDAYRQLRYRRLLFLPRLIKSATDSLLKVLDASVSHHGSLRHS